MAGQKKVAIVGGGHNALVAATLLARAGVTVTVFEKGATLGGAAVSARPFAGVDVKVSPYAYLVSLFPSDLLASLGVSVELRSRRVAWCAPDGDVVVVRGRSDDEATARSFAAAGLAGDLAALERWDRAVGRIAGVLAPTCLRPLRPAEEIRGLLGEEAWGLLCGRPLGESLGEAFESDLVRGVVLTDGLVGTFSRSDDASLVQNRCFLYHVVGNGTGEWRVPVGGMGALTDALATAAAGAGAELRTRAEVVRVDADGRRAEVELADGTRHPVAAVLSGAAPSVLERLLGRRRVEDPAVGAQVKVNMVVERLPRLRAGVDPVTAFTGTLHVNEGHGELDAAWAAASGGALPEPVPCEVYCHSLTDDTVLGPELRRSGAHTLSLFSLQTPPPVIGAGPAGKEAAVRGCLDSLQSVLAEPLEDVLLRTPDGTACVDAHTPADLEEALGLPGGNIFHGSLRWPWAEEAGEVGRWGTETDLANVFLCGAGARRGGGVSGIGGHNAAMAALELLGASAD